MFNSAGIKLSRFQLCLFLWCFMHCPFPWLSSNTTNGRDSMVRIADISYSWHKELCKAVSYEKDSQPELALEQYEQLIEQHSGNATALSVLIPLYWRLTEGLSLYDRRQTFFAALSDIPETGLSSQSLVVLERLLFLKATLLNVGPDDNNVTNLQLQELTQSFNDFTLESVPSPLQHWIIGLVHTYSSRGGVDQYFTQLQQQQEEAVVYEIFIVYKKLLHELSGREMPVHSGLGSWPLPGARADMTTDEMGKRAEWAFNRFQGHAASTISAAWRSLQITVSCFYKARSNPQMFRFRLCLTPFDAARQSINFLYKLLYVGSNPKRRAPWRDMWEWNAGDSEYGLLVSEYNLVVNFRNGLANGLQQDYSTQLHRIEAIDDPEVQEQERLILYHSHVTGFATTESVQNAIHQSAQRLNQIRETKSNNNAIKQANKRFKAKQQQIKAQMKDSPNNEALISQYLALMDSQDARTGLTEESRTKLREAIANLLASVQEYNRHQRLAKTWKEQSDAILSRYKDNPIKAMEDLLELLNSEAGQSLSAEKQESFRNYCQSELIELRAREERAKKKTSYNRRLDHLNQEKEQTGDIKAWLIGVIDLLNSDDASIFSEEWRSNRLHDAQEQLDDIKKVEEKVKEPKSPPDELEDEEAWEDWEDSYTETCTADSCPDQKSEDKELSIADIIQWLELSGELLSDILFTIGTIPTPHTKVTTTAVQGLTKAALFSLGAALKARARQMVIKGGWIGSGVSKARMMTGKKHGGFEYVTSGLGGGLEGAKSLFKTLTGKSPVEKVVTNVHGSEKVKVLFRSTSETGTPVVEIVNHGMKTYEKIHFN